LGHKGVSLTGAQIGIKTDSIHTKARIRTISTDRMRSLLDEGKIVIAAGFQGIDEQLNITTLGRGGSDTTAVALAAVLNADACEIYTDVDGVYTTDPRILPEARRVNRISYDEMLELASLGAGVMHNRSIEFAKKFSVPIHVRSSFTDIPGTMIVSDSGVTDRPVVGAAVTKDVARVTVVGVPDTPGASYEIFSRVAERNIAVDMIVQNVGEEGKADISFTVPQNELRPTLETVEEAVEALRADGVTHDDQVSKVSAVGLGMARETGVADRMFQGLSDAGINIQAITTSEIKISVLVKRKQALLALRTVHETFDLARATPDEQVEPGEVGPAARMSDAADVVDRLRGVDMEELTLHDISLDLTQARVTVSGVPDAPGVAARIFDDVAKAGVFVDMIVQSYGHNGQADLSFTVSREKRHQALRVADGLAKSFQCSGVTSCPEIAKLSVSGIGLRSHTGVAIRMFRALSEAGINVDMVNTSEVRMNVVVDGRAGQKGLDCLQKAFEDVLR
jgi:aspartate kinase